MPCLNCDKETPNPKFCSINCSAAYNNRRRIKPGLAPHNRCKKCGKPAKRTRTGFCRQCWRKQSVWACGKKTIQDFNHTRTRHKHQNVRNHAHRVMELANTPKKCAICEYSVHIELAHLKPISEFDPSTSLNIVNNLTNLRYLCPNHHWESENGILDEWEEKQLKHLKQLVDVEIANIKDGEV